MYDLSRRISDAALSAVRVSMATFSGTDGHPKLCDGCNLRANGSPRLHLIMRLQMNVFLGGLGWLMVFVHMDILVCPHTCRIAISLHE